MLVLSWVSYCFCHVVFHLFICNLYALIYIYVNFLFMWNFFAEKPSLKVGTLKIANVFGMPVQELCIKWTALEGNVIFKLFVGRMDMFYRCNLLEGEVCTHVSRGKNEPFSCFVGKDKLHELFRWQELTSISQCSGSHWCDTFCVKLKRLTRTCNAQACAPLDTYFFFWPLLIQGKMSSKQLIIMVIIKFSTSDNAFCVFWLVCLFLVIIYLSLTLYGKWLL